MSGGRPGESQRYFYPRSPCGERPTPPRKAVTTQGFLSTLSLRRATLTAGGTTILDVYFYPRSPCGERRRTKTVLAEVGDFYPRSPCGERPAEMESKRDCHSISIHALLAESDWWQ